MIDAIIAFITSRVVRIRFGPLRAALWTAWFPFLAADYLLTFGLRAKPRNLITVYLIGIDGALIK